MDGDDQPGAVGDLRRHAIGRDHQGVAVHVGEHRCGAGQNDQVDRRYPGHGRGDDFIAGTDAQGFHGNVHPGRGR
jgi:hypothetical protein